MGNEPESTYANHRFDIDWWRARQDSLREELKLIRRHIAWIEGVQATKATTD